MSVEKDLRLSSILIKWYGINKRDLPWRNVDDPYAIWLSEVILQQTRVDQGYAYFNRFIQSYPTVDLLAKADESEVLKIWQGLGYYSRARNLHAAAKSIVEDYNGVFPHEFKDVLKLKGVGEYTASAIVSFAYNEPYAVVDGNVYRVLSRIFAIEEPIDSGKGKKVFAELARELLDESNAGLHNQAIMEFGALQCVPVSPDCGICPASEVCLAYAQNNVGRYPKKEGKQKVKNRYFNYIDIRDGDCMYLHKRTAKDIWQNLYELPLVETDKEMTVEELQRDDNFIQLFKNTSGIKIKEIKRLKHVLSHQVIYTVFYKAEAAGARLDNAYLRIKAGDVDGYPVSRLVHKYLEQS
ncbi:A/G-specific adenine glycosylase [Dysgonomonas sp. 521]|uniref:A/G-specific adenine glycosylase n=1 Tax=Dysgonomonas sp. 521 TaxID=2302932 RepID=UPI0013D7E3E1|nr:A/G-specific adenine glycosylase [Dysgonomonas sp. 521]NDV93825.1 A/G-specific adenine glycosylase [Dysgonomonas sp. 521]